MPRKTTREAVLDIGKMLREKEGTPTPEEVTEMLKCIGGYGKRILETAWEWIPILQTLNQEWETANQKLWQDPMYRVFSEAALMGRRGDGASEKRALAKFAIENKMIRDADYVLLDTGTTILAFMQMLNSLQKPILLPSVMTTNLLLLNELKQGLSRGNIVEAFIAPGKIDWISGSIVGRRPETTQAITEFPATLTIIGTAGIDRQGTLYCMEESQIPIKKAILANKRRRNCRTLIVCHDTKIDHISTYPFGSLSGHDEHKSKSNITLLTNWPTQESRNNGSVGITNFKDTIKALEQMCHVEFYNARERKIQ